MMCVLPHALAVGIWDKPNARDGHDTRNMPGPGSDSHKQTRDRLMCLPKVISPLSLVSLCAWGADLSNEEQSLIVFTYQVIKLHHVRIAAVVSRRTAFSQAVSKGHEQRRQE